jgi:hypothetical protein
MYLRETTLHVSQEESVSEGERVSLCGRVENQDEAEKKEGRGGIRAW